ncbi:MAG: PIN domain-containing protein, partial [Acidobacteriota bacterium]
YVTVTRKLHPGLTEEEAWRDIEDLLSWQPAAIDARLMRNARDASQRYALSWWDALIVAAAQAGDCRYLLTEDLQDGQDLDGTLVVDPFRHGPDEVLTIHG